MSDYLHHDLFALILKRLAVKTLLRFRCVSKSWKQLIDSKSFISDHLSLQNPRIIPQHEVFELLHLDPQHLPLLDRIRIPDDDHRPDHFSAVSSVHGVICLYDHDYTDLLFLWNPSIRQILRIRQPDFRSFRMIRGEFKYCGFWIDPSNCEFKVVIFSLKGESAAVFSSRKWGWTEVAMGEMDDFIPDDDSAQVLIDGVAHWTATGNWDYGIIVYFDFGQDKLGTINLPVDLINLLVDLMNEECLVVNVCKWKGVLSVIHYDAYGSHNCDLWAMKNGSWSKMFSCKLPERFFYAFCVLESCGRVLGAADDRSLVLYDPKDGRTLLMSEWINIENPPFAYDFVESLVFPCISSG